jgi:hypothetical protein
MALLGRFPRSFRRARQRRPLRSQCVPAGQSHRTIVVGQYRNGVVRGDNGVVFIQFCMYV